MDFYLWAAVYVAASYVAMWFCLWRLVKIGADYAPPEDGREVLLLVAPFLPILVVVAAVWLVAELETFTSISELWKPWARFCRKVGL